VGYFGLDSVLLTEVVEVPSLIIGRTPDYSVSWRGRCLRLSSLLPNLQQLRNCWPKRSC